MIIRKLFKGEMSHVVRNCSTERCSYSIHGHSFLVEVFLSAAAPDNAGMVVDFGLLKSTIGAFIDSFDHCHVLWDQDDPEMNEFIKKKNLRWIEIPVNPSAENLAALMHQYIDKIIKSTSFNNGEKGVTVSTVRYHETTTGYAASTLGDLYNWLPAEVRDKEIKFSVGVTQDWPDTLKNFIDHPEQRDSFYFFHNPCIQQQVKP